MKREAKVEINLKTLLSIFFEFKKSYLENTPKKAKLIDAFCVLCAMLTGLQFFYMLIVGAILKNGLYAGIFTTFGSLILTSNLNF
jgi:hypothetical protein